jgi:hypothetical protein
VDGGINSLKIINNTGSRTGRTSGVGLLLDLDAETLARCQEATESSMPSPTQANAADRTTSPTDWNPTEEEEKNILQMAFEQTPPPPPPKRKLQSNAPVKPRNMKLRGGTKAPKSKKHRLQPYEKLKVEVGEFDEEVKDLEEDGEVLPAGHMPARGRRRPKQLAAMSNAQIAAENQIRMEKNRILAREGRLRKKGFIDNLQVQLQAANHRDIHQRQEIAAAKKEIQRLKKNLKVLKNLNQVTPLPSTVLTAANTAVSARDRLSGTSSTIIGDADSDNSEDEETLLERMQHLQDAFGFAAEM